ncbi:MAG: 50S ribosomal protein L24 [Chloroflexota bacterium]
MTRQTIRIRNDDVVEVISGHDRGARGRVLRAIPKDRRVVIESVNIRKKHQSAVQAGRGQVQAGIIQFEAPIDVSNVMLICPNCGERTRVGLRRENGEAIRVCKKCGEDID